MESMALLWMCNLRYLLAMTWRCPAKSEFLGRDEVGSLWCIHVINPGPGEELSWEWVSEEKRSEARVAGREEDEQAGTELRDFSSLSLHICKTGLGTV